MGKSYHFQDFGTNAKKLLQKFSENLLYTPSDVKISSKRFLFPENEVLKTSHKSLHFFFVNFFLLDFQFSDLGIPKGTYFGEN